jgi:hypothetical protein
MVVAPARLCLDRSSRRCYLLLARDWRTKRRATARDREDTSSKRQNGVFGQASADSESPPCSVQFSSFGKRSSRISLMRLSASYSDKQSLFPNGVSGGLAWPLGCKSFFPPESRGRRKKLYYLSLHSGNVAYSKPIYYSTTQKTPSYTEANYKGHRFHKRIIASRNPVAIAKRPKFEPFPRHHPLF